MSAVTTGRHEVSGLDYDRMVPDGVGDGATVAVLLHGRGSHKGDLQALAPVLPDGWALVTPQAPFPGAEWGYGPGWAWYRYIAEDRVVKETLETSLAKIDAFLEGLPEIVGFEPGATVLGGFSQGGTSSLAFGLTRPGRVAAVWNFSGFLADGVPLPGGEEEMGRTGDGRESSEREEIASTTPVYWGHGLKDPNIPFHLAERGRERLKGAGVPLVAMDYPVGHWMVPDEIHDAVAMVEGL